ncbi:PE family protein [Mycobacterium spongiae]|uniref:PE domain-containing protein n=1 Tax=Mycobacterium spongiae TaxID=886343 RepID=A0A975JZH2_9MYCO|nr:PE family protein [Mycobacterium spongiae]QUR68571.1 PE domain-containing protein [Mycobacterium spongiae]
MSFLQAVPEALTAAASDVAGIGANLNAANAAAAPTTAPLAAAADEVSTQVAALFSAHARGYQQLSAQMAGFHDQFVLALKGGASSYAAAEANAAETLMNAVNAPAEKLLGHPLIGSGVGALVPNAIANVNNAFLGGTATAESAAASAGALALQPAGGASGLAATTALLQPMANALAASGSIGMAIENLYLAVQPWVEYGFLLASYAVGWLPFGFLLGPQIIFLYDLFQPMVQSALFNTIDWLEGTITFAQGLENFWAATTASINQFINTQINWILSFLPPFPPIQNVP